MRVKHCGMYGWVKTSVFWLPKICQHTGCNCCAFISVRVKYCSVSHREHKPGYRGILP